MTYFRKYLHDSGSRQSDFAEKLGVTQATISKLSSGDAKPSLELALSIEQATNGKVPMTSWVDGSGGAA